MLGLHHYHLRKRKFEKLESYPHPELSRRIMDHLIYVVGVLGPIFTIPQVLTIYLHHDAAGVSAISWLAYFLFSIFWFIYGLMHDEKPIIIANGLGIILNGLVAIGAFMYK
jgi:uncharacterized protein with PQ loop repeat